MHMVLLQAMVLRQATDHPLHLGRMVPHHLEPMTKCIRVMAISVDTPEQMLQQRLIVRG